MKYNIFNNEKSDTTVGIVTAKTTLAHQETINLTNAYYEVCILKLFQYANFFLFILF
jgi:hypothetical protein